MKLGELFKFCKVELQKHNITSYQIDSLILISHTLKISKEEVIFNSDLLLSNSQRKEIKSLLKRRILGEPISHIIGKRAFFEDEFLVNKNVLDPRPDSEILIETILEIFLSNQQKLKILELGVGSGCLILTILKKLKDAFGVGVDISKTALKVVKENAKNLKLVPKLTLINSNWFEKLEEWDFDLIISNPPYIKTDAINNLQKEVKLFEPKLALDGGKDGLDCYRIIAKDVDKFLKKSGYLFLEIGQNQEDDVIKIFGDKLKFIKLKKDLSGIIRCLVFQKL